ncbi:hypothetical protein HDK77DRAFT_425317 [Phyllosticta capitalensis]
MEEMQKYMLEHMWRYMFMSPRTVQDDDDESIIAGTFMDVIKDEIDAMRKQYGDELLARADMNTMRAARLALCDFHEAVMIRMQMAARRYVMHMEPTSRRVDRLRVDPILGICTNINPEWDSIKAAHNVMVSRMRLYATLPSDPPPYNDALARLERKVWRRPTQELIRIIDNGSDEDMFVASRMLMLHFNQKSGTASEDWPGYADVMLDTIRYKSIHAKGTTRNDLYVRNPADIR